MSRCWSVLLILPLISSGKSVHMIEAENAGPSMEENFSQEISSKELSYFEGKFNNQTGDDSRGIKMPCQCKNSECACCTGNVLQNFNINMRQRLCINMTYEPDEFSIGVKMSINDLVLLSNSVSGKSPPPLCIRVPRIRNLKFCLRFNNVYFINRNIHACIGVEVEWNKRTVFSYKLDCVRLGADGVAIVPAEAGGGLPHPTDQETDDVEEYDELVGNQTTKKPIPNRTTKKPNRRKTTKKPISNTTTKKPISDATTKKPISSKTTTKPAPNTVTQEQISNAITEEPIPNAITEEPIPNATFMEPILTSTTSISNPDVAILNATVRRKFRFLF